MYKLQDIPHTVEFYGPPHPEDPQGKLIDFEKCRFHSGEQVQHCGRVRILIVVDPINGSSVLFHPLLISIQDMQTIDIYNPCAMSLLLSPM